MKLLKTIKNVIYSSYMCISYPFLYPRNRFTGLHYNNWRIVDYYTDLIKTYKNWVFLENPDEKCIHSLSDQPYYEYVSNKCCSYWSNWWAKPWYLIVKFFHAYIIQIFHCIPTSIEWQLPTGWDKAFGNQYLKDLKKQLKKDKMLHTWRITDIKEKYGSLRLYCNYGSKELYDLIDKYEDLSYNTCIKCGKPATYDSIGWINPYCEDCVKSSKNPERYELRS
jgi:hypothetical protein